MAAKGRVRNTTIALVLALVLSALSAWPGFDQSYQLDVDLLHGLRDTVGWDKADGKPSPVVVVAIDEATHVSAPFSGLPKVMWTPQIAAVQDAILRTDGAVIGWDFILPTSAARYIADKRFDAPLLKSLAIGGKAGRIVLGTAHFGATRIEPNRLYTWSVGGSSNLRSLNIYPDPDGVVRRLPTHFTVEKATGSRLHVPSMALELAARSQGRVVERNATGDLLIDGKSVRGVRDDALLLNFDSGSKAIPTYSFADLHACAANKKNSFFAQHFANKIVLIGLVLDVEDRKLASNRLITQGGPIGPEPRCIPQSSRTEPRPSSRASTSGVYLHAVAITNLLSNRGLETLSGIERLIPSLVLALLGTVTTLCLSLFSAIFMLLAGSAIWASIAAYQFSEGLILPLLMPLFVCLAAFVLSLSIRFLILDREGRFLRRAFASYVAPDLVDKLVEDPGQLRLGGERREMTFLFTDLAGFTSLTESQRPEQLSALLNSYLDGMIAIAKSHNGTIDKVVGDALVVLFSAPIHQPDHAGDAVSCALAMDNFATGFAEAQRDDGIPFGDTRIGVHSGTAVVGNFGGSGFFDYTAFGDVVNTAARLESVNKQLGTRIAVSGETASRCSFFIGRPVGFLILKGKEKPIEVFEPVSGDRASAEQLADYQAAYQELADGGDAPRFRYLATTYPDDPLIRFHLNRIERGETGVVVAFDEK